MSYCVSLRFELCDVRAVPKRCLVLLYLQLLVRGLVSYLHYLCLLSDSAALFCLSSSCVLCILYCPFLWIVYFWLHLRFSLMFTYPSISYWSACTKHGQWTVITGIDFGRFWNCPDCIVLLCISLYFIVFNIDSEYCLKCPTFLTFHN